MTVTILAVGLTVIINSFLSSFRAMTYSKDYAVAVNLLENKMCALKQDGFIEANLDENGVFSQPFEKFRYHLETRSAKSNDEPSSLNEVALSVEWVSGRKKNNILLTTYLFDLPK